MKRKFLYSIFFVLSFAAIIFAQKKIEFTEFDLDNGLHVILHEDHSTPIVAITTTYHVGSKNEDPKRTGFAHFFEHLMFEGTKNIPRGQIDKLILGSGGTLNANTSFDRTFYYMVLPSNQLKLGLWIESERMLHLKVDSVGVETQRKVVKEERKQRLDNQPYGSIFEQIFAHAYKVHPYRWVPIGSVQYIDKATIDEFRDFYKTYYVPNNATLSIAGDIDEDDAKDLIEEYFSGIPRGTKKMNIPKEVEPPQEAEVRDTVYDNIQLPAVIEAYHIPAQGTKDYYAINMLTTLLSEGQSSWLYKDLVDKEQKAVTEGAFPMALEDPGLFITYGIVNQGVKANDLEDAMQTVLDKAKNELITEKEFQKLRNQVENDFVTSHSTDEGIAEALATYHIYFGDSNLINTELERYMDVTREDIQKAAQKYLAKKNRVVLYYLPKSEQASK